MSGPLGTVRHMAVTRASAASASRLTVDEFFALPGEQRHVQLIDGEIVVNSPNTRHQRLVGWLYARLFVFAEANPGLGEPGLELDTPIDEHSVYLSDVWWATPARAPGPRRFAGPPDLAVEVRSPSTWRFDVGRKKDGYEAAGLRELWLVDTETDRVTVWRRSSPDAPTFDVTFTLGAGDTLSTPIIPGLALDVSTLFDR